MKAVTVNHELDKMFDVEPGKTEVMIPGRPDAPEDVIEGEMVVAVTPRVDPIDLYDTKDVEIEDQIGEVYERAIEAHETQMMAAQTVVDKKFAPRNAEIGAEFLKIALAALAEKNSIKDRKDKIAHKDVKPTGAPAGVAITQNTQNNVYTDRNTMMKLIKEQRDGQSEDSDG